MNTGYIREYITPHLYIDDTQLYISYDPNDVDATLARLEGNQGTSIEI